MLTTLTPKTEKQLRLENEELRASLAEANETLDAIRNGEVDAIVVSGAGGEKVFSISSAETPYRVIIEEMNEGAVVLSADGVVLYCNRRFAELVSVAPEQIAGSWFKQFFQNKDLQKYNDLLQAGLKGKTDGELTYIKNGNTHPIHLHLSFSPLPPELLGDVCIMAADITELKQKEEELRRSHETLEQQVIERTKELTEAVEELANKQRVALKMMNDAVEARNTLDILNKELTFQNVEKVKRAKELENANKDLEQFAYVASHDLQEPLRMISSFTQLLERKYKDKLDQDANEYIHFVVDGASRMQKLLINLLDFSRISTRAKTFVHVDTKTIVGQAISILHQSVSANNALLSCDDLPVVKADEAQILRVFQNLIENAIKFKRKTPGSEFPKIHIACTKQDNMYRFSVADNGIGIEMQYHDKVFSVFQRLHSARDYAGTGIGLSICKRIVERHGGTIWFESVANEGTTFYFTIPK
jgi:PAS domain S-box-containing protein